MSADPEEACLDGLYLLTVDQVAERLGVHPQTVRQYIKDGLLGYVELGGDRYIRRRVREDQLATFIDQRTVNR